ncbi:MAG: hypothetical protein ACI857_000522 [Arenicella sp.]
MAQEKVNNDQQQTSKASAEVEKEESLQLKKEEGQSQEIAFEKSGLTSANSFPAQFKSVNISSGGGQKSLSAKFAPIQRRENKTGLPDNLKSGMENLSGLSLDDVKVHKNSDKPAQLNAHAYAQGTNIHLGPGQEKHLPHEAWHVVQQKQGRVKPTMQMKGKVNVNDDAGLEKEADVMGNKSNSQSHQSYATGSGVPGIDYTTMSSGDYTDWKGTAQCKAAPHGTFTLNDQVIVTQFSQSSEILQRWELSDKTKAKLVLAEGILTLAASVVGIVGLSAGLPATLPLLGGAIAGAVVGVIKSIRGGLMLTDATNDSVHVTKDLLDILRALEAVVAGIGAAIAQNPAAIFFVIAKMVRAAIRAYIDEKEANHEAIKPLTKKLLLGGEALAHAVEVGALFFSGAQGLAAEEGFKHAGGAIAMAVGASKGGRTLDQTNKAIKAPSGAKELQDTPAV